MTGSKLPSKRELLAEQLERAQALLEELGYSEERLSTLEIPEDDPLYTAMRIAKQTGKFQYD